MELQLFFKKTTDGGSNWITYNLPTKHGFIDFSRIIRFDNVNKDTIWGVGSVAFLGPGRFRGLLYKSTNSGETWGYQLPDTSIRSGQYQYIQFSDKLRGWAYLEKGGIHTITGGNTTYFTGIKQIPNYIPESFTLGQNYPNTFNPNTSIPFELKESGYATLRVYDIRGVLVKELLNGDWSASKYVSDFDGTNLSSGIYFYKIEIFGNNKKERFSETKRMTLVK